MVPLGSGHDRPAFDCGVPALNRYLQAQATQDKRRRVAACFVAVEGDARIAGFYTLSSTSVLLKDLPDEVGKRLPRYPSVPAVWMGRLAVANADQGQGLGGALVADALVRALRAEIAAFAMLVEAKDAAAVGFYRHHGFMALSRSARAMFLPLASVRALA